MPVCSKTEDNDDDFDLFGEETPEEAARKKAIAVAPKKVEAKKKVVSILCVWIIKLFVPSITI